MGSDMCRSWEGILLDALCARDIGSVPNKHKQSSTFTIIITTGQPTAATH